MSKLMGIRDAGEKPATFAGKDSAPSRLEVQLRSEKKPEFCMALRVDAKEDDPQKAIWINMKHFYAAQTDNPSLPIVINADNKIAEIGELCKINPELYVGTDSNGTYTFEMGVREEVAEEEVVEA